MKFSVIGNDGKEKLRTFDANCIYDLPTLKGLANAGYSFQLGGNPATVEEVDAAAQGERTIVVEREVVMAPVKINNAVELKAERMPIELIDGDTYKVAFKLCRRAKAYDDVEDKTKDDIESYSDAETFINDKAAKSKNYFAGGCVISNLTGDVLYTIAPVRG